MTLSTKGSAMTPAKRRKLHRAGWKVGTAQEFLGLTADEAAFIEMRLSLADSLKQQRLAQGMTQQELARRLGSSQSRVAKIEAADATVSLDLLIRSLLKLGATRQEIGRMIARKVATPAAC
jgi:ribosome-binding protein aMBF1 (putative translation factor)